MAFAFCHLLGFRLLPRLKNKDDKWLKRLTKEDYRGLTPLFYGHIEPYGTLRLSFRELLALHMQGMREKGAIYLFESARKDKYTDRGIRWVLFADVC